MTPRPVAGPTPNPATPPEPSVTESASKVGASLRDAFETLTGTRDGKPLLVPPEAPGQLPRTVAPQPVNEAEAAQEEAGWDTDAEEAVPQLTDTGCGEASLAFLGTASVDEGEAPLTEEEAHAEVQESAETVSTPKTTPRQVEVDLSDGATPDEVGATLGGMGIGITESFSEYDAEAMSNALHEGQYGMALVDSNAIVNSALPRSKQRKEPGQLHWVTIDGINSRKKGDPSDDLFRVRDPVNGTYWVSAKDLQGAIDQGQEHHGSGGMLILEKQRGVHSREDREALAQSNLDYTSILGQGNGVGSKRLSVGESS